MMTSIILAAVLGNTLTAAIPVANVADLPRSTYQDMQRRAPEFVKIKVLSVKIENTPEGARVSAAVEVLEVRRSATRLKTGSIIAVQYLREANAEGADPIPLLRTGNSGPAFLRQSDPRLYEPAARAKSFELILPEPAELVRFAGDYHASFMGDQEVTMELRKDLSATITRSGGGDKPTRKSGGWSVEDGRLRLDLLTVDGRPDSLTFEVKDGMLVSTQFDSSLWGAAGLKFKAHKSNH